MTEMDQAKKRVEHSNKWLLWLAISTTVLIAVAVVLTVYVISENAERTKDIVEKAFSNNACMDTVIAPESE